ncbi:MAG: flagellar biosynthetic protein FliR [Planctomycetaceae bacterium]|nr:flagellar biosynthetic protein FliR [Planctomycetaceae bacterium]
MLGVTNLILPFVFILARLLPLAMLFPIIAGRTIPVRLRLALVIVISIMITPLYIFSVPQADSNSWQLAIRCVRELVFGLGLALSVVIIVAGLQQVGTLISQMSGQSAVDVDPGTSFGATAVERFFGLLSIAIFLSIGGHRQVVDALLQTFQWVPPGGTAPSMDAVVLLAELLKHSFELAIRAAAPVAFSLLMSTLLIGLLSKALPQVGTFGFGLGINFAVMLAVACFSIGGFAWLFQLHLETGLEQVLTSIRRSVANVDG